MLRHTLPRLRVRTVMQLGAPCLRVPAKPVPASMFNTPELEALVDDLVDTMQAVNGAGIAAPQIDEDYRVFVVQGSGNNPRYPYKPAVPLTVFINPVIEVLDDTPMYIIEGCLSVPAFRGRVQRACRVRCTAYRPDGEKFVLLAEGHVAGTLQHELDHLDATLFPDLAPKEWLMTMESFEKFHKAAFFEYAMGLNETYPAPLAWEEGCGVYSRPARAEVVEAPPAAETVYAPALTWTGERLERGVEVAVDNASGRITRVGPVATPTPGVVPLPGNALLPGFVNAHSHAFQRGLRGRGETYPKPAEGDPMPSFWTWREAMYGLVEELATPEAFKARTKQCFEEMAAAGITTCGEFHYFRHSAAELAAAAPAGHPFDFDAMVVEAAAEANVRLVLMTAYYERGGFDDAPLGAGQQRFRTSCTDAYWRQVDVLAERLADGGRGAAVGIVIHSMRAVGVAAVKQIAAEAHRRGLVVHVHLEEQPKEVDDCRTAHGCTPMRLLLDTVEDREHLARVVGVHCTHSTPEDLREFMAGGGGVCICPLTEASLGDGVFQALGVTEGAVSLGTDCNARICMFEEMRLLEYSQRLALGRRGALAAVGTCPEGALARQLLDCATTHGARHLGVDAGAVAAGMWADFALLDLNAAALQGTRDEHVLGAAIFGGAGEGLVVDSCVAGKWTKGLKAVAA